MYARSKCVKLWDIRGEMCEINLCVNKLCVRVCNMWVSVWNLRKWVEQQRYISSNGSLRPKFSANQETSWISLENSWPIRRRDIFQLFSPRRVVHIGESRLRDLDLGLIYNQDSLPLVRTPCPKFGHLFVKLKPYFFFGGEKKVCKNCELTVSFEIVSGIKWW